MATQAGWRNRADRRGLRRDLPCPARLFEARVLWARPAPEEPSVPANITFARAPTGDRPLLGLTVLLIEDSRFACEAMRLLCVCFGARIRRADSNARRHLRGYRPDAVTPISACPMAGVRADR